MNHSKRLDLVTSMTGLGCELKIIFLLQSLLSEIVAVKITMNDTSPLQLPPIEEGRTPSDVYGQLEYAYNIIYALEDALAS